MILEKETFERFGYWPEELSKHSAKPVLRSCDCCGIINTIRKGCISKKCRRCNPKDKPGSYSKVVLNSHNYDPLDDYELLDFFETGSVEYTKNGSLLPFRSGMKNSRSIIPINRTLSMSKMLGLDPRIKRLNKLDYKKAILHHFSKLEILKKSSLLSYYLTYHRTLYKQNEKNGNEGQYVVNDGNGLFRLLFDGLDFKWRGQSGRSTVVIESGSIFLNNRWIHIG